ncbi:MAG: exo-alpha-sialidase [Chitinophagaceae bacterium]|jgi:sialidase-1|nr:exo-alpha-sialidase [Chitinophagaceae bacterium]MBP6046221.1 exo-alpha-sialidase [Ferruginibacter sp.]NMD29512.1 exo-alpha-sialidase [Bacteroidota bacterium]MBL0255502.1 exo-alpha-sialidase [Chitinophagaceae bacterium]MBP6988988.1 exo-alpha-sialidase [Ferruginibacter sp.]
MKKLLVFLFIIFCTINIFSQPNIPVFESGKDGHKSYRIPAIIKLNNGHLLAFAEGRVQGASDFGDVNIVLKISTDNGRTWGSIKTIVDYDTLQAGNPAPVVDLTDPAYTTGRIFLFYNTGNKQESDVRNGNGLREVWYKTSTNGGINWSEAVNITLQTHRPKLPQINPAYNFTADWRSYANTPGHAMQFETGKYKGRIYIAANHSEGGIQNESMDYIAHGFYTDDHGKTFHISNNVNLPGGNENMAAELSDGRIMLNIRNQRGDVRARYIAISSNGGQSWDTSYFDKNLPDPVCQGSLLTIGKKRKQNILAFSNAADEKRRDNLTLRISFDDGKTWKKNFVIYKNPSQPDAAAYSDIVKLSGKKIGVLYEKDNYSKIVFTVVKWK